MGVDLGATWLRVNAVRTGGRSIASARVSATPVRELATALRSMWHRRGWRRRDVAVLVVGSRAIWTAAERRALARRLASLAQRVLVLSDAETALIGAIGDAPGVLILAGTGSIVVGRDAHGRAARAGGLGPLLGDEGSGFWLGREWLRVVTRGENVGPVTALVHDAAPVRRIAALAPMVLRRARRGDRRARAIVAAGQRRLADFALSVTRQLDLAAPVSLSWAGSVMDDAWFRAGVARALRRAGVRARWYPPAVPPVTAAARLAARIAKGRSAR
ncbi:MAG: hypothetical protein HY216_12480 [Candidatus Rokubacteria bacterium]|nr:hypothetical protein [Candidatus Rokubacteria bacterium]